MDGETLVGFEGTDQALEPAGGTTAASVAVSVLWAGFVAAGAYHGYKRNNSVGWAIAWAMLAGAFPFVTLPVAAAQGFGQRSDEP